ncbi:MAG: DUF3043 domain-containing protein [Gemmatales bacterium]
MPGQGRAGASAEASRRPERSRGPVAPPPPTRAEARARKRAEENCPRKSGSVKRVQEARKNQREKMMDGDERYMIARDRGPVVPMSRHRRFAAQRSPDCSCRSRILIIVGMMIPSAGGLHNLAMLVFVVLMVIDRSCWAVPSTSVSSRRSRTPPTPVSSSACTPHPRVQLRMMRRPNPRVAVGDKV